MKFIDYIIENAYEQLNAIANSSDPTIKKSLAFKRKSGEINDISKLDSGSSRDVYHVIEPKEIILDGQKTHLPTVFKVVKTSTQDAARYYDKKEPLGILQNKHESDPVHNEFSVLQKQKDGTYKTNESGILAPTLEHHKNGFWNEMAKSNKFNDIDFREATKSKHFPEGLEKHHFFNAVHNLWDGNNFKETNPSETSIYNHPFIKKVIEHAKKANMDASDTHERNFGIFTHPITGKKYPVMFDYGYSKDVSDEY